MMQTILKIVVLKYIKIKEIKIIKNVKNNIFFMRLHFFMKLDYNLLDLVV